MIEFVFLFNDGSLREKYCKVDTLDAAKSMAALLLADLPSANEVRFVWWPEQFSATRCNGSIYVRARIPG